MAKLHKTNGESGGMYMPANRLAENFTDRYGGSTETVRTFFAPARLILIGEYTDFNGGHVYPCAASIGIYGAVRPRTDRELHFASAKNFPGEGAVIPLDKVEPHKEWLGVNSVLSVFDAFLKLGYELPFGLDLYFDVDMPIGAGMGSAAAIQGITALMIDQIYGLGIEDRMELAKICMRATNDFMGVKVGILDSFVEFMAKKDFAVYLNAENMSCRYVPLQFRGKKIVITDSLKRRDIADTPYNDRVAECAQALKKFQSVMHLNALCDLSSDTFEQWKDVLMDDVLVKRVRHVVYENKRVVRAFSAFRVKKEDVFGKMMNESHVSLRDDFEVSCKELDFLAGEAWKKPYVTGSRMMGAGFGGCTISIVDEDAVDTFRKEIGDAFEKEFGYRPEYYVTDSGDGVKEITSIE